MGLYFDCIRGTYLSYLTVAINFHIRLCYLIDISHWSIVARNVDSIKDTCALTEAEAMKVGLVINENKTNAW